MSGGKYPFCYSKARVDQSTYGAQSIWCSSRTRARPPISQRRRGGESARAAVIIRKLQLRVPITFDNASRRKVKCELAAYQAACKRGPREAITLRQGGHSNQPARDPPRQGRSCGRLGAGVGRLGSRERHRLCSSLNHVFAASPAPASQPRARSSFGHLVGAADSVGRTSRPSVWSALTTD